MTAASGSLLNDRYRLEEEIGRGGMAAVFRARDELLDRQVAVKIIHKPDLTSADRQRVLREARLAGRLNHPNIVSVHDAGEVDSEPYIVMELVEGASLHKRPPASLPELVRVAAQMCAALDHAHSHGVVHRDIKPENVLVGADGVAKLTDFGLALPVASRITSEGVIVGTVFYLAPEQALGQPADGRADLYALGVLLYEFSAGRLPFISADPLAVVSQHLHAQVVPPSTYNEGVPPALESLILELMRKRPEDRPASAGIVGQILGSLDLIRSKGAAASPASLLDRIARGHLVGREQELGEARRAWRRAAVGGGQVLLISGEPGVGKTRLVRELAAQVAVTGGCVLTGESSAESAAPYAGLSQVIEQALAALSSWDVRLPDFTLADLITLSPPSRARFPEITVDPPGEPQAARQRLAESVGQLLAALAEQTPVLLVLEDAHWADEGTLFVIRHLARGRRLPSLRLLLALTYRELPVGERAALEQTLMEVRRDRLTVHLRLGRLDRTQTSEMLGVLFQEETTPDFLDGIYGRTEGNPFFIEELCSALIEQGVLTREAGRWNRPAMHKMRIPRSVRVAIEGRLARLPEEAQAMLRTAAILGREFDFDLLSEVCQLGEDRAIGGLESAERAQLIEEIESSGDVRGGARPRLAFVHALIPQAILESISGLRRRRLHRRVAEVMEQFYSDRLDQQAAAIGRHFLAAGERERATVYMLRAGDYAQSLYAYEEAIRAYEDALGILREIKSEEREARTLMKLGSLHHATLAFARAQRAYQEGFALWQRLGTDRNQVSLVPSPLPFRAAFDSVLSLDPAFAEGTGEISIIDQLFAGLVEQTPRMDLVPNLANSWEIQDEGRKYTFHLRDDVCWSDGVPLTARDFEAAWKRVLDPAVGAHNARYLFDVKGAKLFHQGERSSTEELGIVALDDHTLRIELEAPASYFLYLLAISPTYAIPAHVVASKGEAWTLPSNIVTCGPFRIEEWVPPGHIVLSRSPTFHGKSSGNLQRVEVLLSALRAPSGELPLYEANRVSFAYPPESKVGEARHRYPGQYVTYPSATSEWVWIDLRRPPFNDGRVRRAFVHACDRERLVLEAYHGLHLPATGGLVPVGIPGHQPGIGLAYDLEKARALLAEAGYGPGREFPTIDFLGQPWVKESPGVRHLLSQWSDLGINFRVSYLERQALRQKMEQDPPHMFYAGWLADYPDPDSFLRVGVSTYADFLWSREYSELILAASEASGMADRLALYAKAERLLIQEAAIMPVIYFQRHFLLKPWVRQFPISPLKDWFWKDVVIELDPGDVDSTASGVPSTRLESDRG